MKKLLAMLLCLLLVCASAMADGDGGIATPRTYEELIEAMNNSRYNEISLRVKDFVWPTEEITLDFVNLSASVTIVGEFTFPENVTVNCAQAIHSVGGPGDVTVNGPWNCLSDTGMIYNSGGNAIYNGPVTFTCDERVRLSNSTSYFIFNGPMQLNAQVIANSLTLGDGVVIEGEKSLQFSETLSVPEGTATIHVALDPSPGNDQDQPTLAGNMTVAEIRMGGNSICTIAQDSHVTVNELNAWSGGLMTIDGTMELPEDSRHNGMNATLQLNETGVLILGISTRLAGEDGGRITGEGTLELYANVRQNDKGSRHPKVFGMNTFEGLPLDRVAETIKIVKNWKE